MNVSNFILFYYHSSYLMLVWYKSYQKCYSWYLLCWRVPIRHQQPQEYTIFGAHKVCPTSCWPMLGATFIRPSVFILFFLSLIEKITSYFLRFKLYEVLIILLKLCIINIVREREIINYFIQLSFINCIENIN